MRGIVSRQMDNWKLPHVNSSLNVWGMPLWHHTIFTEVTDRTLWCLKCSRSALFLKEHLWDNKRKRSLDRILSIFSIVFVWATTRRAMERSWHLHSLYPILARGRCLIKSCWSHKIPNPKFVFKNCRIKEYFDALVYDLLSFKTISPFFNVCKVWLYTLSQCIGEQNQLGSHIIIHWRSYALGFCQKPNLISI